MAEEEIPVAHRCTPLCDCNCNWPACACHFPDPADTAPTATEPDPYACLRCGASSLPDGVRAINKDGRTIDLCYVHTPDHRPALEKQGWTIVEARVLAEAQAVPA